MTIPEGSSRRSATPVSSSGDLLTVEQAAKLLGKHPETIRRAVRKGTLPDGRANPRGHLRIRRGDLQALAAPAPARYDPVADAQDIAQRRRPR